MMISRSALRKSAPINLPSVRRSRDVRTNSGNAKESAAPSSIKFAGPSVLAALASLPMSLSVQLIKAVLQVTLIGKQKLTPSLKLLRKFLKNDYCMKMSEAKIFQKTYFKPRQTFIDYFEKRISNRLWNLHNIKKERMVRGAQAEVEGQIKPRKKVKLDVLTDPNYNEFEGNELIEDGEGYAEPSFLNVESPSVGHQGAKMTFKMFKEEENQNEKVFRMISKGQVKFKKISSEPLVFDKKYIKTQEKEILHNQPSDLKIEHSSQQQSAEKSKPLQMAKTQEKAQKSSSKQKKQSSKVVPSSNWKLFLEESNRSSNANRSKNSKSAQKGTVKENSKFVAMDCEFVKCGESDVLARLSIVGEQGSTLYDSYIKPDKKITDYLTSITGITFSHIKNAPSWNEEVKKVKKILLNKMLVGHTINKDLEVSGLTGWKGVTKVIDIADFSLYKQKNSKLTSLKNLSLKHLDRKIQSGWHSSVEDALATMDLFLLNRKNILKECKII